MSALGELHEQSDAYAQQYDIEGVWHNDATWMPCRWDTRATTSRKAERPTKSSPGAGATTPSMATIR